MPYQNLLVPIAPTEDAGWLLARAAEVAAGFQASTVLMAVLELPVGVRPSDPEAERFRSEVEGRLTALADDFGRTGLPVATLVREGHTVTEILEALTRLGTDMVVIGTHGRTGIRRLVLGSIAEAVVRRSPVPVLVVPAPLRLDTEDINPATEDQPPPTE